MKNADKNRKKVGQQKNNRIRNHKMKTNKYSYVGQDLSTI